MSYAALAIAAVAAALVIFLWINKKRHQNLVKQIQAHVLESFSDGSAIPDLEVSYFYGYPAFKLTFASESELESAVLTGMTREFLRRVQYVCFTSGPSERPFNAEQAVFFTYVGYVPRSLRNRSNSL